MKGIAGRVVDAYRILLRLYPLRFQQEYGEEMSAVFCKACRDSTENSKWSIVQLGLHEVWDLPGNLIKEYAAEMGRYAMNSPSKPGEQIVKSILRGIFSFSSVFGLIYLICCSIDTFLNAGNLFGQENSFWKRLYLQPTGLAFGFGVALMGLQYGKRKSWLSALAAFIAFHLFSFIFSVYYQANRSLAPSVLELLRVHFFFETITGIIVGGVIGLIQHGWKKAGWFALAGFIGFNIGWIIKIAVEFFVLRQCPYTGVMNQLIVGDPWYFFYFVLPVIFYGGIVGLCMGIASAGVNRRILATD